MRICLLALTVTLLAFRASTGSDISLERRGGDVGQSHAPPARRQSEYEAAYAYEQAVWQQAWLAQQQAAAYGVQPAAYPAPAADGISAYGYGPPPPAATHHGPHYAYTPVGWGPYGPWGTGPYGKHLEHGHPGTVLDGGRYGMFGAAHGTPGYPHHHHAREYVGPQGPPTAQVAYPYYTIRGPRDFLLDNPPSIGR